MGRNLSFCESAKGAKLCRALFPILACCVASEGRPLPLVRVVDLNVGEARKVTLSDGSTTRVTLVNLKEKRCRLRHAVREATVTVEVDGRRATLACATYHLPVTLGRVQIDCPVTRGYIQNSSKENVWSLERDARFRLWPAGSPWIRPGTFRVPVNQRLFVSDTQMANEPCYVNACDIPGQRSVYYHYGLDFGGAEGLVGVCAATSGVVVSRSGELLPGEYPPQVRPRYDVVYIRDDRGWYYRYSHLKSIDPSIKLGRRIQIGDRIGLLGKEGGSGGWSHLHFDLTMPQPSGRYGITDAYAFAFQAYCEKYKPAVVAVARPHKVAWVGQRVLLDGTKSYHVGGADQIARYEWILSDGRHVHASQVACRYARPGHYSETLKVTDRLGRYSWDTVVVQVFPRAKEAKVPPAIHAAFWPTEGLKPGRPITFKVRSFALRPDEGAEVWDFGDGSPLGVTRSDGNARQHAPDGYAVITHTYKRPGDYFVTVSRTNNHGQTATARLWVHVGGKRVSSK